jgi:hypothetical protein
LIKPRRALAGRASGGVVSVTLIEASSLGVGCAATGFRIQFSLVKRRERREASD